MPHCKVRLKSRNAHIVNRYRTKKKMNPKWTFIAIIEDVANEFYLAPVTVTNIIKKASNEKVPSVDTIIKSQRLNSTTL